MCLSPLCRVLVVAVCLLCALPAWGEDDVPLPPSPPPATDAVDEGDVRALIEGGRFAEALALLRLLLEGETVPANAVFLFDLAPLGASQQPGLDDDERDALLNEAIVAFHAMLVEAPGLVRLELARAFFLKGEDDLARRHFEAVLAGGVPEAVAANVSSFLAAMQTRKRWSFNIGAALAPDSNIGAGSAERTIYIFGLPFERDAEELTTSGIGVSVWGGAEYQVPLAERWRGGSMNVPSSIGSSSPPISACAAWWTQARTRACWRARSSAGSAPCRTIARSAPASRWGAG